METRYTPNEFVDFWSLKNKYQLWFKIEKTVYDVMYKQKVFRDTSENHDFLNSYYESIEESINVQEILEIEKETKHDVVAFLKWLEIKTEGKTKFFHYGMTSSDLVDNALSLQINDALSIVQSKLSTLRKALTLWAKSSTNIPMMGRSHGMHAQVTTLGNFFLGHLSEINRAAIYLNTAHEEIKYGKLSGPVGSYTNMSIELESSIITELGLKVESVSTQIIPRDRHLAVVLAIARVSTALERFATNIRHLHRSEIMEVMEGFSEGQKGSSSMPHKKNPIGCENICGISRYIRGMVHPAFENVVLWNERDISHSSVERMIIPESITYCAYIIDKMTDIVTHLHVNPESMKEKIEKCPERVSEYLMLSLISKGMTRDESHELVEILMRKVTKGTWKTAPSKILKSGHFTDAEVSECFDLEKVFSYSKMLSMDVDLNAPPFF